MRSLLLCTLLLGCNSASIVVGDLEEVTTMRAVQNPNLDILFVIDNSGSMSEQQASLAANFPLMIDVLEQLDGGLPNLHIGVVTSDMGTSSSQYPPGPSIGTVGLGGCAGVGDDGVLVHDSPNLQAGATFISDVALPDGSRDRNYTGALRDVFADNALIETVGCGFEQHLSAMRRALTNPLNAGFLRPEANLAVVIIGDEDDCSLLDPAMLGPEDANLGPLESFRCAKFGITCDQTMTTLGPKTNCIPLASSQFVEDTQPFVAAVLAAKSNDPRQVMVAGIIGDPSPFSVELKQINGQTQPDLAASCTFAGPAGPELAFPGVRLAAFVDSFPGRSTLTSICDGDLSSALQQIGSTAKKLVGDPCLDVALADASPDPGLQPACEVSDVRDSSPSSPTAVPVCATGSTTDCYEIAADPVVCPSSPENLRIRMRRAAAPAGDTWTHVRCQIAK
jgi:hypothetical protein